MPDQTQPPTPVSSPPDLPLFYRSPEPLNAVRHGNLKLRMTPDFRFAAGANAVPIMGAEFAEAMRFYPIVFADQTAHPVAVLGLEEGNLFVDDQGQWSEGGYVPAYVRRYPFVFIEAPGQGGFRLGVDAAYERLEEEISDGAPFRALFEDGKPSGFTEEAMRFAGALQAEHAAVRAFGEALNARDLLIDRQAEGMFPDGKRFQVAGFRVVDSARFRALPSEVVLDWHARGWLALAQFHLASLRRFKDLLTRRGERAAVAQPIGPTGMQ